MATSKLHEDRLASVKLSNLVPSKKYKKAKPRDSASQETLKAIASVSELFPGHNIAEAIRYLKENGKTVDVNNLIDAIYNADKHPSVHEECLDSQGESCHSDNLGEPPLEASGFYVESVSESEDEEVQSTAEAVLLAKKQLKEKIVSLRVICQSCRNYPASILLLPCAHIACCEYCLMDVRRCPVPNCKKIVRGTKEVFFG